MKREGEGEGEGKSDTGERGKINNCGLAFNSSQGPMMTFYHYNCWRNKCLSNFKAIWALLTARPVQLYSYDFTL